MKARLNYFLIIPLLICMAYGLPVIAQQPFYKEYTVENGAPSNEIYSILKDRDEFIWIGSDAGVYRFNGVKFQAFKSPELKARSATGLCQSASGKIYGYNFKHQLFYIENDSLHVISEWKWTINGIAADRKGFIWISGYEGLYKLNESNFDIEKIADSLHVTDEKGNYVADNVRTTKDGRVLYHQAQHLIEINKRETKYLQLGETFYQKPAMLSISDHENWLLDGETETILRLTERGWIPYNNAQLKSLLKKRKIASVIDINDGFIWIHSFSGLIRLNKSTNKVDLFYPDISFSGCVQDYQGNYWFSTLNNGLFKVSNFDIHIWNKQTGALEHEQISQITALDNHLYLAASTGELYQFCRTKKTIELIQDKPNSDFGMLFADTINQKVLFNKTDGLFEFSHGQVASLGKYRPVKALWKDEQLGFVVCTSQGLFAVKETLSYSNELIEFTKDWTRGIEHLNPNKRLAVASNSGLIFLDYSKGKFEFVGRILPTEQLLSVSYDRQNNLLYALSFDGKIYQIDADGNSKLFLSHSNEFLSIQLVYYQNAIYLATNKGVVRYTITDKTKTILDMTNGLSSNNIRFLHFDEQFCWAATGRGLHQIPLEQFNGSQQPIKLILDNVQVSGQFRDARSYYELTYDDNITLHIEGLSYSSGSNFFLAYNIKNYSDKWILVPGESGRIDIPKLPQGDLILLVKLIDHLGNDSATILQINLNVAPPFYNKWWFYLIIAVLFGGAIATFFRLRITILRKKQRQVLRQLKLENELRLTQQNALKAQMNPHFLFNVLNSIKAFIYENDKKNAARYLSDFSNLVRNVLELSAQPKVSLQKELDALKTYIELEAMLIQHDFEYSIKISPNVNSGSIQIPALIIQPYVENAFKHGLRHKQGSKILELTVDYKENSKTIEIQITDNGIGRAKSQSINASNPTHRQSFATSAIEKRIRLLNHEQKNVIGVEIIDNFEGQTPQGTTVIIRIHV